MSQPPLPGHTPFAQLPRAHGAPLGRGRLRVEPEDFQVEERLAFEPDGDGEHLLLWVRKREANTEWAARRLAACAGVAVSAVGYAGLKDRHAVTWQWFSLPRPRAGEPDWSVLAADGIEVLEVHAHRRKLRRGALVGNRFRILVRDLAADPEALAERVAAIGARGVPNYFGEQRFGRDGGNLAQAHALFSGAPVPRVSRHVRGLWLSAARSQLFNEVLAGRVADACWDRPLAGDRLQLDGCNSHFAVETVDETLLTRCARLDVHPTGPLWGEGAPPSRDAVLAREQAVAAAFPGWPEGLAAAGLAQERRALRLPVFDLVAEQVDGGVRLAFELPAGAYATAVLRELLDDWNDAA
ncbi:tRNA pseudouridine(13) synthase TruD [Marichromatium gracile]|uniref:tRNA pseudouridine(13) synthase TruD n=1 Tax=Marichromatium gracile TaxID=1048 RepID=UPI001F2CEDE1|nr:tRNA pseudouridine(13) synthase TruD [Marichromatium gracile]MCF1182711.1 tRNA pseudouridine(13) synthase TruD [Marichromatium gracile]